MKHLIFSSTSTLICGDIIPTYMMPSQLLSRMEIFYPIILPPTHVSHLGGGHHKWAL